MRQSHRALLLFAAVLASVMVRRKLTGLFAAAAAYS